MKAKLPYLAVVACLCAFALAPLGYPGYWQPQAGFAPVYALYDWEAAGLSLRWSPAATNATWGPLSGDGPLAHVLAEGFRFAGLNGTAAVKCVFALAFVLGAIGSYRLFRTRTDPLVAIALAVVWAYSPMSLAATYVRGQPGAALALGLLPWCALAMLAPDEPLTALPQQQNRRRVGRSLLGVLAGVLLGLAHCGFALVALAALAVSGGRRRWLLPAAGVALAALWVVPQAARTSLVPLRAPVLQLALPYQLFTTAFGYGSTNLPWAAETPAPLGFGIVPIGLLLIAFVTSKSAPPRRWLRPALVVILLTALATTAATPLWQGRPLTAVLAGPWQLLALAAFLLVVVLAAPIGALLSRHSEAAAVALVLIALVAAIPALESVPVTQLEPSAAPLASFDDGRIVLIAAELHGPLRHGATPRLRLYWQATEPLPRDYTVFIHVLDEADTKWGQRDSQPADRQAPTTTWRPGAVIVDEHPVYIDINGPVAGYHIVLGLYDLETGERLLLPSGDSALELSCG